MKVTILTAGSRGDVQPYIALGLGLQAAGHSVRIVTHHSVEDFVRGYGLDFSPVEGNPRRMLEDELGQRLLTASKNPLAPLRHTFAMMKPIMFQVLDGYWQASLDADVLLFHLLLALPAASIAEKLAIPAYPAYLQHVHATRAYPAASALPLPVPGLNRVYNRLTYSLVDWFFWSFIRSGINQWRERTLNLPPYPRRSLFKEWQRKRLPFLYGFSPHVVPRPPEWGDEIHVTGYWFLDGGSDWQPPSALLDFLASGPPPVCVGFGSMVTRDPEQLAEVTLEALALSKQRGLLLTGWSGISNSDLPDEVFKIDFAPHDWLFPRMAAVVHHGGAGTTAAGLRAGVPAVVVPFFGDQFFWAWRVASLRVGPSPIPRKKLSARRLATAIEQVIGDTEMRKRAAALGEKIRAEDGVARAVAALGLARS
jgi:UDP:flavonoid glycosyltransferase YjiC (YdhE family)